MLTIKTIGMHTCTHHFVHLCNFARSVRLAAAYHNRYFCFEKIATDYAFNDSLIDFNFGFCF